MCRSAEPLCIAQQPPHALPYVAASTEAHAVLFHAVQWVTHAFCHANWGHLSMNLFNLCVFGKVGPNKSAELTCPAHRGACIGVQSGSEACTQQSTCAQRGQHQLLDAYVLYLHRVTPHTAMHMYTLYSVGQTFEQTMHVSQDCKQAEYPFACCSSVLHALMSALHSHGHPI
jgi:hypothetical protein